MYCPNCGTKSDEGVRFCKNCGRSHTSEPVPDEVSRQHVPVPTPSHEAPPHVPNRLIWAILVTIFCCLPFGIVSIVYAAKVNGRVTGGEIEGARRASKKAKTWAWVAFGTGLVVYCLFGLVTILTSITNGGATDSLPSFESSPTPVPNFSELKAEAGAVTYDELFRNNELYTSQLVYFTGEVVQVVEHFFGDGYDLRVNVSDDWPDSEVVYLADYEGPRLLEDDRIEFVGESVGLERYQAIMGNAVTIPRLKAISVRRLR